jgi:hypothetical protein
VKRIRNRLFKELHPDKDSGNADRFAIVKAAVEFLLMMIAVNNM